MPGNRTAPIEMGKEDFRKVGYQLIDKIADFIGTIKDKKVTTGESPQEVLELLGTSTLPEKGMPAEEILSKTADIFLNHSLLNGHPKFLGYITSSAAPIGALGDLLVAAVNPNVGANILSPVATEIEKQTVKWLTEFIGIHPTWGGILVSGGNMANFTAFLVARTVKASKDFKEGGISDSDAKMLIYCSSTTHTWIEKAAVLFGHGTKAIRWIQADANNKMDIEVLKETLRDDLVNGFKPIMVIGTAGDVSTGAVDNLKAIAAVCKTHNLWFHVDGAYGAPAAATEANKSLFEGIEEADSIALDPHKWLYSPLEAGCTLIRDPNHMLQTYSSHPVYYNFSNNDEPSTQNYYEYGLQNSRGFRALKVWLALQQVGRTGYVKMIEEDIRLSKLFFELAKNHPELEAITQNLSITTLRYVPYNFDGDLSEKEAYLNALNEVLLNELQKGGEVFLSNALVNGKYCLRGCIVNFRTSQEDIEQIIEIIVRKGKVIHQRLQSKRDAKPVRS